LLKKFSLSRPIPLYICDDFAWKQLRLSPRSVAHHNTGIAYGTVGPHEAILIREEVLMWDDAQKALPKILQHELTHAKLRGKEKSFNKHGKLFGKTAKKYGAAIKGDF
jgi:hypothetical protein